MHRGLREYALALTAVAAAVLLRYLLDPWLGDTFQLVTIFGAVAAAVWVGGTGPALLAVVVGFVACDYLFIPPRGHLALGGVPGLIALFAYLATCALIIVFGETARRAHAQVTAQRELLRITLHSIGDAVIATDVAARVSSMNPTAETLTGWTVADALGRPLDEVFRIVNEATRQPVPNPAAKALQAGVVVGLANHTVLIARDGQERPIDDSAAPIRDEHGNVAGCVLIFRDVSVQRQAEADREKFVTLIENSPDFIGLCDVDGHPFYVNRAGLEMVGLADLEEARRTPVSSFFFPEDQFRIIHEFFPRVVEQGVGEIDVRFRHFRTGEARWMAYKVVAIPDAAGKTIAFATVSQDVTERRRLVDDLGRAAADLSDVDRRKNEFLAMLAHELRNPLAPISNAARALRLGASDPVGVRAAAAMLERQVGQLSRLVDDLLDVSRITRGRIELRRRRIDLASVVEQAVEVVRPLFEAMQHELTVVVPSRALPLDADPARLAQVIGNLLNNAGKFTDRGGRVALSVEVEAGDAVIRVRDSGIGIAPAELPRVFDMFAQVDTSLERSRDGLGIGLTLVKMLVDMHGGRVEAHSDGLGHGSEFVVRLPLAVTAAATAAGAPTAPAVTGVSRRVLIVDDSDDGAESLAVLLQLSGHQTWKAHDGVQAIEAAARIRPDVVLLDIGLPRLNGYEACRRIRSEPWGAALVMVALTGWGQDEDRRQSMEAGFDAHMVKPVDPDALLDFLASLPTPADQQFSG